MQIKIPTELFRAAGPRETLVHKGSIDGPWTTHVVVDVSCDWPVECGPPHLFFNTDVGHMAAGISDHMDHLRRLASRGQRDES